MRMRLYVRLILAACALALCSVVTAGALMQPSPAPEWETSEWLNGSLANLIDEMVSCRVVDEQFDSKVINKLVSEHRSEVVDHGHFLWALIVLGKWWDRVEMNRSELGLAGRSE